jgi:hypothetical protein
MLISNITWNVHVSSNQNARYEIDIDMKNLIVIAMMTSNTDNAQPSSEIEDEVTNGMKGMSMQVEKITPIRSDAARAPENPR